MIILGNDDISKKLTYSPFKFHVGVVSKEIIYLYVNDDLGIKESILKDNFKEEINKSWYYNEDPIYIHELDRPFLTYSEYIAIELVKDTEIRSYLIDKFYPSKSDSVHSLIPFIRYVESIFVNQFNLETIKEYLKDKSYLDLYDSYKYNEDLTLPALEVDQTDVVEEPVKEETPKTKIYHFPFKGTVKRCQNLDALDDMSSNIKKECLKLFDYWSEIVDVTFNDSAIDCNTNFDDDEDPETIRNFREWFKGWVFHMMTRYADVEEV